MNPFILNRSNSNLDIELRFEFRLEAVKSCGKAASR